MYITLKRDCSDRNMFHVYMSNDKGFLTYKWSMTLDDIVCMFHGVHIEADLALMSYDDSMEVRIRLFELAS